MSRRPTASSPASTTPTATTPIPGPSTGSGASPKPTNTCPHLKDNAHGTGHRRPAPAAPPRADVGMPGAYSEATSRVLTMLEETWQAIRARHPEIPPVVIIIASGTTGRDARWGHFDPQRWTVHTTGTLTRILLIQTAPVTHLRGWYGERRPRRWQTPR